jgi:hypothetical protein
MLAGDARRRIRQQEANTAIAALATPQSLGKMQRGW